MAYLIYGVKANKKEMYSFYWVLASAEMTEKWGRKKGQKKRTVPIFSLGHV